MTDRPLTFDPSFKKLGREIERFANHTHRFVKASQRYRSVLERASEWTEGTAPLDCEPDNPAAAMRAIDKFARTHRERRQTLFGAYFAHHHLRAQAELSRALLRRSFSTQRGARSLTCRAIHADAYQKRRAWVSALIEVSLAAAAPDLRQEDYAIFNVGALTDHEDVDLAIVVSSIEARNQFAKGFGPLNKTFLRFASKIQLFLADQFAEVSSGGLIEEYADIVSRPVDTVVVVMQLLGAEFLCGSRTLANRFEERITDRFYAESGDPLAHEGFLRAVMAELRHYHNLERLSEVLAPKREIYIPSKLVIAAMRVIHGVRDAHPPTALLKLAERNPERKTTYVSLSSAFIQNEVLRALLFLYVIKTDEIDLYEPTVVGACRRVAVLLGLGKSARRSAEARLLSYYKDLRARAMGRVFELSFDINAHLRKVSTFRQLIERGRAIQDGDENLALRLLNALRRYQGGVFWDEIVDLLSNSEALVGRFLDDLMSMEPEHRQATVRELVHMMCVDAASLVELLVFLADHDRGGTELPQVTDSGPHASMFWEALIHVLATDSPQLETFLRCLDRDTETEALYRLANSYPPERLSKLADFIEDRDSSSRGDRIVRALRSVIILVHHHSNRTGRIGSRVLGRIPEFVHRLGEAERLRALARDLMTQAAREPVPREQVELLGDAFDVEVLSASLVAILEGAPSERDRDYVAALDLYVRELFKACFGGVQARSPMFDMMRPGTGMAVYATGGFGRGEGFGADWDYLAVVDDDDPGKKKFFGKVIQRLAAALSRRGVIPHNRFANEFNSYVVSIPQLRAYFTRRKPETFIDEAEVIEARYMFGDLDVRRAFAKQVHGVVLKDNRKAFLQDILRELRDRRTALPLGLNIKHGMGGLREIHLLWLALGVMARVGGSFRPERFADVAKHLPARRSDLRFLLIANAELRRVRDLYRLVVADQEDPVDVDALVHIARDLRPLREAGARPKFAGEIERLMMAAALRIDRIAVEIAAMVA